MPSYVTEPPGFGPNPALMGLGGSGGSVGFGGVVLLNTGGSGGLVGFGVPNPRLGVTPNFSTVNLPRPDGMHAGREKRALCPYLGRDLFLREAPL